VARYFHVTSSLNRDSIERNGLDWRLMEAAHGVAGIVDLRPHRAEVEGIYLCEGDFEVDWFAEMAIGQGHPAVDVWEVSLPDGADLVESDNGYRYYPEPIARTAIRLVKQDWSPESRFRD
jgi:hypothetical protein